MKPPAPTSKSSSAGFLSPGFVLLCALALTLVATIIGPMWHVWRSDQSLSHGPLVPLIAAGLLWMRRDQLPKRWDRAYAPGLILLCFAALLHVAAVWADVEFLTPLSILIMAAGVFWFLGGREALSTTIGPLGFMVFMIPWPTVLVERISFPLQLTSSSYAAMFSGLAGIPVQRNGVELAVQPDIHYKALYSILVAQKCSGLTSLMVLLALSYLIAYHTPVGWGWRALMVAVVVPLTLFTNAFRLMMILIAGAYHSRALADWVHHNEGPVLILFCSMGLMGFRYLILKWTQPRESTEESLAGEVQAAAG